MSAEAASVTTTEPEHPRERRTSTLLLVVGVVGRTWLWFVAGCLAITLLPILIGWRPYVVQSGSMRPRIDVGDVILAAPASNAAELLGRVVVFSDPEKPGQVKSHRVVAVNPDGTLTTKGDANPTVDSSHVRFSDVRGMGRLLVTSAGLPLVWERAGEWWLLLIFLASLLAAAWAVSRDQDPDEGDDDDGGPSGGLVPLPARSSGPGSTAIAAARPLGPGLRRAASSAVATLARARRRMSSPPRLVRRTAYAALLVSVITVPGVGATFAATTNSATNAWTVGSWNYTGTITDLTPWMYWKLDETSGTTAGDTSGNNREGTYDPRASAFTRGIVGALTSDSPNLGVTLNGTTACISTTSTTAMIAPTQLTEIVWFKTTTTMGGKLFGFETPRTGVAVAGSGGTYDRHLYMDGDGKVWFGVYNGGYFTIPSPTALNDGTWHMAAATMGTGGMTLYVDGTAVGTSPNSSAESTTGWFRAGCGNLAGWGGSWGGANSPTTNSAKTQDRPFAGSLDEISVWQTVLTATQIRQIYLAR
jgi:signal peptidase I